MEQKCIQLLLRQADKLAPDVVVVLAEERVGRLRRSGVAEGRKAGPSYSRRSIIGLVERPGRAPTRGTEDDQVLAEQRGLSGLIKILHTSDAQPGPAPGTLDLFDQHQIKHAYPPAIAKRFGGRS